jgi:hypothetical protein
MDKCLQYLMPVRGMPNRKDHVYKTHDFHWTAFLTFLTVSERVNYSN